MPIYSYLCDYCGHEFDEIVRSVDPEVVGIHECRCGSMAKKIFSIPAAARGNFGTTRRNAGKDKLQEFNFNTKDEGEQLELDFNKKDE